MRSGRGWGWEEGWRTRRKRSSGVCRSVPSPTPPSALVLAYDITVSAQHRRRRTVRGFMQESRLPRRPFTLSPKVNFTSFGASLGFGSHRPSIFMYHQPFPLGSHAISRLTGKKSATRGDAGPHLSPAHRKRSNNGTKDRVNPVPQEPEGAPARRVQWPRAEPSFPGGSTLNLSDSKSPSQDSH